jgi:hypothetical protein
MERHTQVTGVLIGAAIGAAAGYLLFTAQGRRVVQNARRLVEDLAREAHQAAAVVEDLVGEAERWPPLVGKVRHAFSRESRETTERGWRDRGRFERSSGMDRS